VNLCYISST